MGKAESNISKFKTKPFDHQLRCLNDYGRREYFSLAAEQGTGKSFIIINDAADLWSSGDLDGMLLLAPNGVHSNWTRLEIPKHMPDWVDFFSVNYSSGMSKSRLKDFELIYKQNPRTLRIFAVNWDALNTVGGYAQIERFCNSCSRLMIVADESSNIKNPSASRTKALMKLKKFSSYRRIVDGTPVTNSPFDAFSQYLFLDESILQTTSYFAFKSEYSELLQPENRLLRRIAEKRSAMSPENRRTIWLHIQEAMTLVRSNGRPEILSQFKKAYEALEIDDEDSFLKEMVVFRGLLSPSPSEAKRKLLNAIFCAETMILAQQRKASVSMNPNRLPQIVERDKNGMPKYKNLGKLSELIAPHTFRVLKKDCLDLPEKIYKTVCFEMTKQQQIVYDRVKDECRLIFEGNETPVTKLVAIGKLAQITSGYYIHPDKDEPVRIEGENPKMDLLMDRVGHSISCGEKIIIWARYRIQISDIVADLKSKNINCVEYHGGVSAADRTTTIDAFESGNASVFVANQQSGGTGITLVAASEVIYFSNDFSLHNRLQSEDRAHRIGQKKNVVYTDIVALNSIDEFIVQSAANKKDMADAIMDPNLNIFL